MPFNPTPDQDLSGLPTEMQMKIKQQNMQFKMKCDENEIPLTDEEEARDLRGMSFLDLGDAKNYKTKIIQNRWAQQRNEWLLKPAPAGSQDPHLGKDVKRFPPLDFDDARMYALRKREKKTMKSTPSPYEPFAAFYPLGDVIDTYFEIWFKDDSSSSSS